MLLRPASVTSRGCQACQRAILSAVSSAPSALTRRPSPAVRPTISYKKLSPAVPVASFATESSTKAEADTDAPTAETPGTEIQQDAKPEENDAEAQPWFLEVEPPRSPESTHKPALPLVPDDAPAEFEAIMKYVYEDMGLDELSLLDLRELDPPAALGPNLMMLFGTARSERHLHISGGRLVRWLRRNYQVEAHAAGLIGAGELKTKLRRLRKKAKLMGTNTAIVPGGDNGISTGWICVNFTIGAGTTGESVSFDQSGRQSGFGAEQTGTTLVIQCMTETRRSSLDLEDLWQETLKSSLRDKMQIQGKPRPNDRVLDDMVGKRVQLQNRNAMQWQAMKRASHQHRLFSTTTRRFATPVSQSTTSSSGLQSDLDWLQQSIRKLQISQQPLEGEHSLERYIHKIFDAVPSAEDTEAARVALGLVDRLLLTARERGTQVLSTSVLVDMIASIVSAPGYGPELQRAQGNLELLVTELQQPLSHAEVSKLMHAHGKQGDWPRFWEAFRQRTRFLLGRSWDHYALAFQYVAQSGNMSMCLDTVRTVFSEMKRESFWGEEVIPDRVYQWLRACLVTADPEVLQREFMGTGSSRTTGQHMFRRRLHHRESLAWLRQLQRHRVFHGKRGRRLRLGR